MGFKKYNKIHRLGKDETNGILDGVCFIQEKLDGANTSIWVDDGEIQMGSRNQQLKGGFNGFCDYVNAHEGIKSLLSIMPDFRLYGEWLVRHTISYSETAYKRFYLFDIMVDDKYLPIPDVYTIANQFNIDAPYLLGVFKNPTDADIKALVGKSMLGDVGEGIVIKNPEFINEFGDQAHAKVVTEKFKEDNGIVFGGNNKYSESYWEMWVVNKYITLERVQKILHKIEPTIDGKLDMEHIPRIVNTVYNDMLTEEIWVIQKKVPSLKFRTLKRLVMKKAKQIFVDILNNDISVADKIDE